MSEAKTQDGCIVTGYRTLSHGDTGKMNQFKELSRQFIELMRQHGTDLNNNNASDPDVWQAFEWCRQAEMTMKQACMFACRAVAQPDDDC